jgi:beta propeller repeat protein
MSPRNRMYLAGIAGIGVLIGFGIVRWACSDRFMVWQDIRWGAALRVRGNYAIQYSNLDMRTGPVWPVYGRAMDLRERRNLSLPSTQSRSIVVDAEESWGLFSHGIEMGLTDGTDLDMCDDLYAMDLRTSEVIPIRIGKTGNPRLDDEVIVWVEMSGDQSILYGYDLQKREKFLIHPDATWRFIVQEGYAAWRSGWNFYVYDLDKRTMILVREVPGNYIPVLWISGRTLIWGYSTNLFGLNFDSGQVRTICQTPEIGGYCGNGNHVAWSDRRNGTWDIYGYDLDKGAEFPLCVAPGDQKNPQVSGSRVVWSDNRNGNWDIYGYDLETGTEFPVCTDRGDQTNPAIDGNIVIWFDAGRKSWWMRWIRREPGSVQAILLR